MDSFLEQLPKEENNHHSRKRLLDAPQNEHTKKQTRYFVDKKQKLESQEGINTVATKVENVLSSDRPLGFEVTDFEMVCPLSMLKIRKKRKEDMESELQRKMVHFCICGFDTVDQGISVLKSDGTPKRLETRYTIVPSSRELDTEKGEARFYFDEGFRFKDWFEFEFLFKHEYLTDNICT